MQHLGERTEAGVRVQKAEVGHMENNVYVLSDPATRTAYVVDAGYEPEAIAELARGLAVKAILVTHGHRDHHENVGRLRELLGAPVAIGAADREMLSVTPDLLIEHGDSFALGSQVIRAIHTPGHTPGSTCLLLGSLLFTGDTLFPGGPGNTKKDPVRFAEIIGSIRERLFTLPPETHVLPGHGRDTTLGAELPHLDEWIARGW